MLLIPTKYYSSSSSSSSLLICMARTFDVCFCTRHLRVLNARHVSHSLDCSEAAAAAEFFSLSLATYSIFHFTPRSPVCAFFRRVFEIFQLILLQTDTWCVCERVHCCFVITNTLCSRFVHRRSYVFDVFVVLRSLSCWRARSRCDETNEIDQKNNFQVPQLRCTIFVCTFVSSQFVHGSSKRILWALFEKFISTLIGLLSRAR